METLLVAGDEVAVIGAGGYTIDRSRGCYVGVEDTNAVVLLVALEDGKNNCSRGMVIHNTSIWLNFNKWKEFFLFLKKNLFLMTHVSREREREREREWERERECVYERESVWGIERESVCGERERERKRECVCVWERERERWGDANLTRCCRLYLIFTFWRHMWRNDCRPRK